MTTIFERRGNPVRNLYRLWDQIIAINGGNSAAYGTGSRSIYRMSNANPGLIAYGHLSVAEDGRFRLMGMHGHKQRRWVSEGTFLGFRHWRSGYNWFVDFGPPSYWQSLWAIDSWEHPMPYVRERLVAPAGWNQPDWWLELAPHTPTHGEPPWMIVPATNQRDPQQRNQRKRLEPHQRLAWDRFVALREKRYELLWREALGQAAPPRQVSVRTPSVTSNGIKHEGDAAVWAIRALLDVHQPAKLAPRLKEAHA